MIKHRIAVIVVLLANPKYSVVVVIEHAPVKDLLHGFLEVSLGQLADLLLGIELELGLTDTVICRRLWSWCILGLLQ